MLPGSPGACGGKVVDVDAGRLGRTPRSAQRLRLVTGSVRPRPGSDQSLVRPAACQETSDRQERGGFTPPRGGRANR